MAATDRGDADGRDGGVAPAALPARDDGAPARSPARALVAAALALPGMIPGVAGAQTVPDRDLVALRFLDYRDWRPGADRMSVHNPAIYLVKPVSDTLVVEGTVAHDSMSGASPLQHDTLSGASRQGVTDYRTAGDVKVTKYLDGIAIGVGAAVSFERDYLSRAGSVEIRLSTDDRNRTWTFGIGGANDRIDPVNGVVRNASRNTLDFLAGVTQALSPTALVQTNLTYSRGHGYYSDPYKPLDTRPDRRSVVAWLTRYNVHLPAPDATIRLGYRYLRDSFGSRAHTMDATWFQTLPAGWSVAPGLRHTTQSAASFYFDPPFPRGYAAGRNYTADTRLSAFGALAPSVAIARAWPGGWSADVRFVFYRQRADWRVGGGGSPGLAPFSARWIEAGFARAF